MDEPRIAPGGLKELGLINFGVSTLAGKVIGGPRPHVFTTLGRQRRLFRAWLHFSGRLMPGGSLPRRETELIILRIATLRACEYERRHHLRLGRKAGVTPAQIEHLDDLSWPGWSVREPRCSPQRPSSSRRSTSTTLPGPRYELISTKQSR
ncbi:carboxymuconolactone decarboxylase family protein [Aeromicrobium sp. UC242_57]|uniref:carboxymuconolactone decarboxylase family protein n=1 Tax=Aeromicrobium sp. UC242_57 TaxID=3374624 RepID=UPI0037B2AB65